MQKFKPAPAPLARCIDWERMLMEFEWPHYKEVSTRQHILPGTCCMWLNRAVTGYAVGSASICSML